MCPLAEMHHRLDRIALESNLSHAKSRAGDTLAVGAGVRLKCCQFYSNGRGALSRESREQRRVGSSLIGFAGRSIPARTPRSPRRPQTRNANEENMNRIGQLGVAMVMVIAACSEGTSPSTGAPK